MTNIYKTILLTSALIPGAALAQDYATGIPEDGDYGSIVITAGLEPVRLDEAAASVTLIQPWTIEALDLPKAVDLLRLSPGVAISKSGADGSQTQVRLRGAEANHTLVLLDGFEVNDPGSSNEFRWEYQPAAALRQVEVLRGPSSALWGSEALGGVVALQTFGADSTAGFAEATYGSHETVDAAAGVSVTGDAGGAALYGSYYDTEGTDSFAGGIDERDGSDSLAIGFKGNLHAGERGELQLLARYGSSETEFDGTDPVTFLRTDTLARSTNEQVFVGGRALFEPVDSWQHQLDGSWLVTDNRNFRADEALSKIDADSFRVGYQTSVDVNAAGLDHRVTLRAETRSQTYESRDREYFGATDQKQSRTRNSIAGEYRLTANRLTIALAARQDWNDTFEDAFTWRAAGALRLNESFALHASAGRGVAAPTFTEQFGFFPGSFVGNPDLEPERSFGWDAGVDARVWIFDTSVTWFQASLEDEIVSTYDSATFLSSVANATGESDRRGIEATARTQVGTVELQASYTWLDADEAKTAGTSAVREVRRPEHSGNVTATADFDRLTLGLSVSYVGDRRDVDFDSFPSRDVTLDDYFLASATASYRLVGGLELTGRVENAFDARYEDVFGYATPGIAAYGGVRWRWGD